jgi:transposase
MARGYSNDLRVRVIEMVETGEARREAARTFSIGASTAIRWARRWKETGSVAAKPGTGKSRSPLAAHRQWLLDLVARDPDLTLEEVRDRLIDVHGLVSSQSAICRFYLRHKISFKKNRARRRAGPSRRRRGACAMEGRAEEP